MILSSGTRIGPGVTIKQESTLVSPYLPSTLFELDASTYTTGDWVDGTGNGRNATLYNSPSWNSDAGGCFVFDGNPTKFIYIPGSEGGWGLADNPAQATFSVWANIPGPTDYQHIAGWRGGLNFWFLILSGSSTTEARFDNGISRDINIDYGVFMGTWALTTFVVDASAGESRLYINGSMVGSNNSISGNFYSGGVPFTLGADYSQNFSSVCKIGGAMAYSKVLDVNEINTEFNRTKARYGL